MVTTPLTAEEMLKLSRVKKKRTRMRVELWKHPHLEGALENEDLTNEMEKN